jgi:hypothetical protein
MTTYTTGSGSSYFIVKALGPESEIRCGADCIGHAKKTQIKVKSGKVCSTFCRNTADSLRTVGRFGTLPATAGQGLNI